MSKTKKKTIALTGNDVLDSLDPDFREKAVSLLINCKARGVEMKPYIGLRHPLEQARLWRQSRSDMEIQKKILQLEQLECDFLLECLLGAGGAIGAHATNNCAGESWHNFGLALDCYAVVNGKISWNTEDYAIYAEEAKKLGLEAGYYWKTFKDAPHVHFPQDTSPLRRYGNLKVINDILKEGFDGRGKHGVFSTIHKSDN